MTKQYVKTFNVGGSRKYVRDTEAHEKIDAANERVDELITIAGSDYYLGMSRVTGATDPALTATYGSRDALLEVLSHFRMGAFKNSQLQAQLAPGRITLSADGRAVAIDGTDGDILPYIDKNIYFLRNAATIDGEARSLLGLGLAKYAVGAKAARKMKPFAVALNGTVMTQLSYDSRSCAHNIYNPSVAGYYTADPGWFKQHLRTSGGGYPNTHVSAITAAIGAQDRNADNTAVGDAKPLFHDFMGLWLTAMYLELGTLDFTRADLFGTGCTNTAASAAQWADTAISAVSGMKTITADGTERLYALCAQNMKASASATAGYNTDGLTGSGDRYNFTEMLEMLRVLDNIKQTGRTAFIGTATNIFTDQGRTLIQDGSVNLSTGEGMVAGQKYYVVRSVPGCQGLADGVMTAVVNVYLKMECQDGVQNSSGDDLTGGCCIYKMSHPVYRGWDVLDGKFVSIEGSHYVFRNDGGSYSVDYYYCEDADLLPLVRNVQADYYGDVDASLPMLAGYEFGFNTNTSDGWAQRARYDLSLHAFDAVGGSMHYNENAHVWKSNSYSCPEAVNNKPKEGKKCVNASFAGCGASAAVAGRTCSCNFAVSFSADYSARGFAQCHIKI